jgi:ribosomal peptide maturation radical SAM protein 1
MPWALEKMPSIQLGILKSIASNLDFTVNVQYLNLKLAFMIGMKTYDQLIGSKAFTFLGEWLFNPYIFPDYNSTIKDYTYLDHLRAKFNKANNNLGLPVLEEPLLEIYNDDPIATIKNIRECVIPEFLNDIMTSIPFNEYEIIGFTCTFNQTIPSIALARLIKEKFPDKFIIMGGAAFEDEMGVELITSFPWLDCCVHGEAELVFPEIVELLRQGKIYNKDKYEQLQSVSLRIGDAIYSSLLKKKLQNLDDISIPNYEDYFNQLSNLKEEYCQYDFKPEGLFFETSRGCWWGVANQCKFCGLNGTETGYRSKSPARAMCEILHLSAKYKSLKLFAVDNAMDFKYFDGLLDKLVELNYHLEIFYEIRPNLTKEMVDLLCKAGVKRIQPGIESFSTKILKLMNKGTTAINNIQLIKWCKERCIDLAYNILWGFPDEDPGEYLQMAETIKKLFHLQPPSCPPRPMVVERFSPYFEQASQYNLNPIPSRDYTYLYPPNVNLNRIAYIFDTNRDFTDSTHYIYPVTEALLEWHKKYYSNCQPVLVYEKGPNFVRIYDTRSDKDRTILLEDMAAEVFLFCDGAKHKQEIIKYVQDLYHDLSLEALVNEILDNLVKNDLFFEEDMKFLSLAIKL